mgnify:CR=1
MSFFMNNAPLKWLGEDKIVEDSIPSSLFILLDNTR